MCGEFVGTVLFLYFALSGAQVANSVNTSSGQSIAQVGSNPQQLQYIALSFGFSLAVNAWVFFRISGGLFNPAVTFGMCLIGALPWVRGGLLFVTQILGGMAAAGLVSCMFPGELNVRTTLGGGTTVVQGLFIEMFLTAQLVFTIFMLAAEKHKGTFIAPVGIGLSLFIAELTGVFFTGGSLNPARSFGPAVVDLKFAHYRKRESFLPLFLSTFPSSNRERQCTFLNFLLTRTAKRLDLLAWTRFGIDCRSWLLQIHQDSGIRDCKFSFFAHCGSTVTNSTLQANPGQDMDHAAKVEKRKNLLIAAGINEVDAHHVANELQTNQVVTEKGGPDGGIVANGQGRRSSGEDTAMYGTGFRANSHQHTGSTSSGDTAVVQRPQAVTTGSQLGRFSYLGRAGVQPQRMNSVTEARLDSPAMATNDELYAPLAAGGDEPLGGMVADHDPRYRYSRTISSGV
jgi:aquaporin related protein